MRGKGKYSAAVWRHAIMQCLQVAHVQMHAVLVLVVLVVRHVILEGCSSAAEGWPLLLMQGVGAQSTPVYKGMPDLEC